MGAATNSTKLKVYIQAAIHGNEPAADEVGLHWISSVMTEIDNPSGRPCTTWEDGGESDVDSFSS